MLFLTASNHQLVDKMNYTEFFPSNLVESVDFSDSRVALLWAGL